MSEQINGLHWRVSDAQDKVFTWHADYVGVDKASGSAALRPYGEDWQDAWEAWWDYGNC